MSKPNPVELLADIYLKLENGDKAKLRQAKELIIEMQAELADLKSSLARQPLPEAPASLTTKVIDPNNQIEYLVTVRQADAGRLLINQIPAINQAIKEQGLIAFDAYVDKRRAERKDSELTPAQIGQPASVPPNCPTHNRAMKPGKNGGWYCSAKIADDDGTGKPVYCKQKA